MPSRRFASGEPSIRGLGRNARWALKQMETKSVTRGGKVTTGIGIGGNAGADIPVQVPEGLRRKLAHHFKYKDRSVEGRLLFSKTNGFGTVSDQNIHLLDEELQASMNIGFDRRNGVQSNEAGPSHSTAYSRQGEQSHSYDDIDYSSGKSHVQSQFDEWVVDAIVNYCPVTVQSVRVNELYTMLRRVVPNFTVDAHCDGMPLSVLCSQCSYLQSHGGRLHFMRVIKPTGRHVTGSKEHNTSSAYTVRRAEEDQFTAEDDENDKISKRMRKIRRLSVVTNDNADGEEESFEPSRTARTDAASVFDQFNNQTRHLDPDSLKRALLKSHLQGRQGAAHSSHHTNEEDEVQNRRSDFAARAASKVGISRNLRVNGSSSSSQHHLSNRNVEEEGVDQEAFEHLDDEEERLLAAVLKGDKAQAAALHRRYEDSRAMLEGTSVGGNRLSGAQVRRDNSAAEEDGSEDSLSLDQTVDTAYELGYSEGVLSAEAIVKAYEQHVHRRLGETVANVSKTKTLRNTHVGRRSPATVLIDEDAQQSLSLSRPTGGDDDGFAPVTNLNIFDIHDDGSVLSLDPTITTSDTNPLHYLLSTTTTTMPASSSPTSSSSSNMNENRRRHTEEDVAYPLLYPTLDPSKTDTMKARAEGELPTTHKARTRASKDTANWHAPRATRTALFGLTEAEASAMEKYYGRYVDPKKEGNEESGSSSECAPSSIRTQQQQQVSPLRKIRESVLVEEKDDIDYDPHFGRFGAVFHDPNASKINHPHLSLEELYPHYDFSKDKHRNKSADDEDSASALSLSAPHTNSKDAGVKFKAVIDAEGYETLVPVAAEGAGPVNTSTTLKVEEGNSSQYTTTASIREQSKLQPSEIDPEAIALEAVKAHRDRQLRERWELKKRHDQERRALIEARREEHNNDRNNDRIDFHQLGEKSIAFDQALSGLQDAAFECLMLDEENGNGGAAAQAPVNPSRSRDSASDVQPYTASASAPPDEAAPVVPASRSTMPKSAEAHLRKVPECGTFTTIPGEGKETPFTSHTIANNKMKFVDDYFDNTFFRPEETPEPGTVSVTAPHLKPMPSDEYEHLQNVVKSKSPYKGQTIEDYYAMMRGETQRPHGGMNYPHEDNNRTETDDESDALQRSRKAYGNGNHHDEALFEEEDDYLASLGENDNDLHGDRQSEEVDESPRGNLNDNSTSTGGKSNSRRRSRSFDEGFSQSEDVNDAGENNSRNYYPSYSTSAPASAFSSPSVDPRARSPLNREIREETFAHNLRGDGDEKKAKDGASDNDSNTRSSAKSSSSSSSASDDGRGGGSKRYTYTEADADIYADPEAALLDGRAMTVGLSKYAFKQSKSKDGVRKGPEKWKFPAKDTFLPGTFKKELKNRTLESKRGRSSLF